MSIYDFTVTTEKGESYSLSKYQGKVLVIINTATKCGLAPQFKELEEIYEAYKDRGVEFLGFPSNQFKQEVADSEEAAEACRTTYGVSFPMHKIIAVNGEDADPLFRYLTSHSKGFLNGKIKWNFTKFVIDREGHVVERLAPKDQPEKLKPLLDKYL